MQAKPERRHQEDNLKYVDNGSTPITDTDEITASAHNHNLYIANRLFPCSLNMDDNLQFVVSGLTPIADTDEITVCRQMQSLKLKIACFLESSRS